jgi:hypothetical protein
VFPTTIVFVEARCNPKGRFDDNTSAGDSAVPCTIKRRDLTILPIEDLTITPLLEIQPYPVPHIKKS